MSELRDSWTRKTRLPTVNGKRLRTFALLVAYPALRHLQPREWNEVLVKARETGFDTMEWMGIVAGVAVVTYLSRFDADQAAALTLPARYLVQFLVAVPLLTLVVGPFHLRRTRRGLDLAIQRQHSTATSNPQR